ncbi:Acetyltransferase (GNAT) family protein [Shimia gijangensis]|uniref:Acetyltransferase (GNAT) family protein n=1 Tax=Shimia gijangensis TaxID=1470563 RepID=A0A1M6JM06_9RHOB|nr:GNAT family N-acetyltransferase [Shimia gijangensis]SHJ47708.1 Acetyltransferase (GNAT) family protein [Shimia gijangensis]
MPGFEIQRAVPEQGAALCGLLEAAYQPYRDRGVALPDVTNGLADEIAAGRVWVAMAPTGLFGLLNLSLSLPAAHLINVAVSPVAKGQGVGGALIRFAVRLATDAGCETLDLATHADLCENIALYTHLGWETTDTGVSRVRMTKRLTTL